MRNKIVLLICLVVVIFLFSQESLKCGNFTFYEKKSNNTWSKIKYDNIDLKKINSENYSFLVNNCNDVYFSNDKRVITLREVLVNKPKDSINFLSTYEAPYTSIDIKTGNFVSYVGKIDNKIVFFSDAQGRAEFSGNHNKVYNENVYYLSTDFLKMIPKFINDKKIVIEVSNLEEYIEEEEINSRNVEIYNNIAFNLNKSSFHKESVYILKKILKHFPQRTVTYLNLANANWDLGNKENAKENYKKYLSLMKSQKKDLKKIPKKVYKRIK